MTQCNSKIFDPKTKRYRRCKNKTTTKYCHLHKSQRGGGFSPKIKVKQCKYKCMIRGKRYQTDEDGSYCNCLGSYLN